MYTEQQRIEDQIQKAKGQPLKVEEYAADGHGSHNCRSATASSLAQAKAIARKWAGGRLKSKLAWSGCGRGAVIAWHESEVEGCGGIQISLA